MKDQDWEIIKALYDCGNLTRAANRLFMSQPTLSKTLNRIEKELGAKIINRSNKGISFTEAGSYLAAQSLQISRLIKETNDRLEEMVSGKMELSIGSATSFARYDLPNLMSQFNAQGGQYRYKVRVMPSSQVISAVERQEFQVGFVNGDRNWEPKILCAVAHGYIVSREPVTLEELPGIPMICHHNDAYSLQILEEWWRGQFNTPMKITYTVSDISTSLEWISQGMGYGVMYESVLRKETELFRLKMLDRNGRQISRNTWAIYQPSKNQSPLLKEFLGFLARVCPLSF